ncbi:MAG: tripartite tricarboxylate transporter TctB family protein [Rhizobiaceae bacterium]|nr:tripartite tricarboxylate transporter TctB family protein [Rhizobiaceae bacterium]
MSVQRKSRSGELAFALILLAFSMAALWQAYGISGFKGLSTAGVFPMLAAAAMVFSGFFILKDVLAGRVSRSLTSQSEDTEHKVLTARLVTMIALVILYVAIMPYLGFIVASAGFLFLSFSYLWRKNILISTALTGVTLMLIYGLFRILFQVVLPKGSLIQGLY